MKGCAIRREYRRERGEEFEMNEIEKKKYKERLDSVLYDLITDPRSVENNQSRALILILELIKHTMEEEK